MQVILDRTDLMDRLSVIERGLPGRSHFAPAEGIYMESKGDKLVFCSNNLEMAVRTAIPVMDIKKDATILPKRFIDIIKQLPDPEIHITLKDDRAEIKSGKAKFKLNCMDAEGFPLFSDDYETYPCITLEGEALRDLINKTTFCVSTDISKQIFRGVMIQSVSDAGFVCYASDTYRLVCYERLKTVFDQPVEIIIPGKLLTDVGRIVKDDDIVRVYVGKSDVVFVVDNFEISVRLLEGKYPELGHTFPEKPLTIIIIDREDFMQTINRARLMTGKESEVMSLSITDVLEIKAQSETGRMNELLPIKVEGEQLGQIMINAKYVLEGVKAFDTDELIIEFNGDIGPVVMRGEGFKYLVLPIKPRNE